MLTQAGMNLDAQNTSDRGAFGLVGGYRSDFKDGKVMLNKHL